jgi:hypothetical protein
MIVLALVLLAGVSAFGQTRYKINYKHQVLDEAGVEALKNAVRAGYKAGYAEGKDADKNNRAYNRHFRRSSVYYQGDEGYGKTVPKADYVNFFRAGWEHGFDDGYSRHSKCGKDGELNDKCLSQVLVVQQIK